MSIKSALAAWVWILAVQAHAALEINTASEAQLEALKGIGPATARKITVERHQSAFRDWEDVKTRVKGIGHARSNQLSAEGLTVAGQPYKGLSTGAVKPPVAVAPPVPPAVGFAPRPNGGRKDSASHATATAKPGSPPVPYPGTSAPLRVDSPPRR
jgi:competence protein ComEA